MIKTTSFEKWGRLQDIHEQVRFLILTFRDTPEKKAARLTRRLQKQEAILRRRYAATPYYIDQEFLARYAAKNTTELLSQRRQIVKQYLKFARRRALIEYLERQAPELLAFARWRLTALEIAERLNVEPPPPRRRPTEEEIRAFKVRKARRRADDKIALKRAELEAMLQARSFLNEYELDEDERLQMENELIEDIRKEDNTNGTSGKETL